jgi:hypothetical protein
MSAALYRENEVPRLILFRSPATGTQKPPPKTETRLAQSLS